MSISDNLHDDLLWWKNNFLTSSKSLEVCDYQLEFFTDASLSGWRASCNGRRTELTLKPIRKQDLDLV